MTSDNITTSWIWPAGSGVNGMTIDTERGVLDWFDNVGCACGDSSARQTYAQFMQQGPAFGGIPVDVMDEIRETLLRLS